MLAGELPRTPRPSSNSASPSGRRAGRPQAPARDALGRRPADCCASPPRRMRRPTSNACRSTTRRSTPSAARVSRFVGRRAGRARLRQEDDARLRLGLGRRVRARLVKDFGDRRVASMVHLRTYSNFPGPHPDRPRLAEVEPGDRCRQSTSPSISSCSASTFRATPPLPPRRGCPAEARAGNDLVPTAAQVGRRHLRHAPEDRLEAQRWEADAAPHPRVGRVRERPAAGLFRGRATSSGIGSFFGYAPEDWPCRSRYFHADRRRRVDREVRPCTSSARASSGSRRRP